MNKEVDKKAFFGLILLVGISGILFVVSNLTTTHKDTSENIQPVTQSDTLQIPGQAAKRTPEKDLKEVPWEPTVIYDEASGKTARVEQTDVWGECVGKKVFQERLTVQDLGGEEMGVYTVWDYPATSTSVIYCNSIDDITFSPLGKYIFFHVKGWEWSIAFIFNLNTRKNIIEDVPSFSVEYKDIVWSPDERMVVVRTRQSDFYGDPEGLYLYDATTPDALTTIMTMSSELSRDGCREGSAEIANTQLSGNDVLFDIVCRKGGYFNNDNDWIEGEVIDVLDSYEYNITSKELRKK